MKYLPLLLLSFNAYAGEMLLTWTAPTQWTDGSALSTSDISGFHIYCYQNQTLVIDKAIGNVTADVITLPSGTYGCRMTAIPIDGTVSDRSNKTAFTIEPKKANPPVMQ